jgi:dihydrolipoamide dehydrogenase
VTRIAIIGGGPASYESALVAAGLGAEVTVIDRDGLGGACVLTDCVPSKTLIAGSDRVTRMRNALRLGLVDVGRGAEGSGKVQVDLQRLNDRVKELARQQSEDIAARLSREGVAVVQGFGRFAADQPTNGHTLEVRDGAGSVTRTLRADIVLIATGGTPRVLPTAVPDGERILSWRDVYDLDDLPDHLIVIGSGVTGAEFASAYSELGAQVTLVSSRERVLPSEDPDAAEVIEQIFTETGGTLVRKARASAVRREGDTVVVELESGGTPGDEGAAAGARREVVGSHALMCVGSVPNTEGLGLEHVGVARDSSGYIEVDRVSRTNIPSIYAAGDCTGVLLLASVAGMQGRIAMWHALGEAVQPLRLKTVAANVFTHPEIATVGVGYRAIASGEVPARQVTLPLATNARAKMTGDIEGFVKVYCRPATGVVVGGVVVAPNASELIFPLALAVRHNLTVDDIASTIGVYPSLSGSVAEAARQLMDHDDLD